MATEIDHRRGPGTLCFRADASSRIGTGHIMRCLALAQAWKHRGGDAAFLCSHESEMLRSRVLSEGFQWATVPQSHPAPEDLEIALRFCSAHGTTKGKWIVLDGYHFDEEYQLALREAGHKILVIDDVGHLPEYHADILLNQSLPEGAMPYRAHPETRLLLGQRYVLLRNEFLHWRVAGARRHPAAAENILVTLGGADPDNVTRTVIDVMKQMASSTLSVRVIVGATNRNRDSLEKAASSAPFDCRLLDATNHMPALMEWADMAVSGGGTTCWEMAFMGLPNLVIVLAENQKAVAAVLRAAKCSVVVEDPKDRRALAFELEWLVKDRVRREAMSRSGRWLIDGRGGQRVADLLLGEACALEGGTR